MDTIKTSGAILAIAILFLGTEPAQAVERNGFTIGLTLGGGALEPTGGLGEVVDGLSGATGHISLGGFVSEWAALMFDAGLCITVGEDRHLVSGTLGLLLQLYPSERFHLGFGTGYARFSGDQGTETGGYLFGGNAAYLLMNLGYDVWQTTSFGLALFGSLETVFIPPTEGEKPPMGVITPVVMEDADFSMLVSFSAGLRLQWY